ncbi:MAG: transposase [Oscillibacter sp.]|nr:transposase [Oscillibacter sp.]
MKSWDEHWDVLSTFYEYPPKMRKIIYTTNIIEGLKLQFRQITKNTPIFTKDDSLRRMPYLTSQRIMKHWYARCLNWDLVHSQLEILFVRWTAGYPLSLGFSRACDSIHAASCAHTILGVREWSTQGILSANCSASAAPNLTL